MCRVEMEPSGLLHERSLACGRAMSIAVDISGQALGGMPAGELGAKLKGSNWHRQPPRLPCRTGAHAGVSAIYCNTIQYNRQQRLR